MVCLTLAPGWRLECTSTPRQRSVERRTRRQQRNKDMKDGKDKDKDGQAVGGQALSAAGVAECASLNSIIEGLN